MFCVEERNYTINHLEQRQDYDVINEQCYKLTEFMRIRQDIKSKQEEEIRRATYERDSMILDLNIENYIND